MTEAPTRNLLFVCTGNTCRSPMAERLMADLCNDIAGKDLTGWSFTSAGVFAVAGAPASELAVVALKENGIDLSDHRARPLSPALVREADVIVAMTQSHRDLVLQMEPGASDKTHTLHSFGSEKPKADVLDPFGGELDTYRIVRDEITSALNDLVLAVIKPPKS